MQIDQPQHSKQRVIEVANQSLIYQSVTVHDNPITGTQIATAVGFPLWQDSCHHLKFNQLGALRVDSVSL